METESEPKPEPIAPPRKRRRWRYALHTSHVLALVVSLSLLLYLLALPVVVRRVVKSTLAELGYPGATFNVRTATLWAVELADIRPAGGDAAVIRGAMVRFSPIEVFGGRLRSIELMGAEVPLTIRDGSVQFSLAPKLTKPERAGSPGKAKRFPFDRLEVAASTLRVDWEGRQIVLPVEGAVTPVGDGARIELSTFFQGTTIPISGTLDGTGAAVDLSASATNLSVAGIRTAIPWALLNYPFQTSGRADVRLQYNMAGGRSAVALHVEPKNVWVAAQPGEHQLAVQRVNGTVDVELLPGMQLGAVAGTLRVGRFAWDDLSAERIEFAVRGRGADVVEFEGTLASDGWRLLSLKGSAAGVASPARGVKVSAEFRAKGQLPHQVVEALNRQGIVTEDLGDIGVRGSGTLAAGGKKPWELVIPALAISMDPGGVVLRKQGVTLAGMTAEVSVAGKVSPDGASLSVAPNSRVAVGSIITSGGVELKRDDPRGTMLTAAVADEPVTVISSGADSKVLVPHLAVAVGQSTLVDRGSGTNVRGVGGVLNVGGEVSGRQVNMVALKDSWIGFGAVEVGAQTRIDGARFAVLPVGVPLLGDSKITARLRSSGPVAAVASGTKVSAKSLEVTAVADLRGDVPGVGADVAVEGGAVVQPSWGIEGIAARIPVSWNAPAGDDGSFSVESVSVGAYRLPRVTGTLRVVDKSVAVTAVSEVTKGAVVKADADVEWTPTGLRGRAATTMPSFKLEDEKALGQVWKPAAEMGLTGTFSFDGEVLFNGPLVKPRITASVKDAKLTSAAYDLNLEGANGSVTINNFDPLSGPGLQRLRVEKLHLGKLDLTKGGVEFRVEGPDSLHVERSRWTWVGGQIYTYDLRINPSKPQTLNAVVYADRLDLKQLLGALAQGEATGQGQLYGRLPVKMNWPELTFGDGFLYATGSGGIAVGKRADAVEKMLDESELGKSNDPKFKEVKSRIIQALRNFNYDTLKVDFLQKNGGLTASITVVGKGGTGPNAQELNLTVNLNGVDQVLSQALVIKKALGAIGQ